MGREEKGERGHRGDLLEKKESPKGERAIQPVSSLPSKKWVLKIGFLKAYDTVKRLRACMLSCFSCV